jgi:hypothetical protein
MHTARVGRSVKISIDVSEAVGFETEVDVMLSPVAVAGATEPVL